MFYEREYFVHYYDSDIKHRLTVSSLMKFLEDIAILHSENVNVGLQYYEEKKVAWVLYKWGIKINRYPKFKDTIKVRTRPVSLRGFQAYRYFDVLDEQGDELVTANSMWLFVNTATKRPTKINEDMYTNYKIDINNSEKLQIEDVPMLNKVDAKKDFYIRYSDIDTNNHVNNITYVNWAMEVLPLNIMSEYILKELNVLYKKEIAFGKMITSSVEIKDYNNKVECVHLISSENEELCRLETKWFKE